MITDHFKKTHLDALMSVGWETVLFSDSVLKKSYEAGGFPWIAFAAHMWPGEYRVSVSNQATATWVHAVITPEDFGEFVEEELERARESAAADSLVG